MPPFWWRCQPFNSDVTRLLIRWGLEERLNAVAVKPEYLHFCRCVSLMCGSCIYLTRRLADDTGERLGFTIWGGKMERDFNAPYLHIHVRFRLCIRTFHQSCVCFLEGRSPQHAV